MEVEYILKVDDDMFIYIFNLVFILKKIWLFNVVIGCFNNGVVLIRDLISKWYVLYKEYLKKFYLFYCSGIVYVFIKDLIGLIYNVL